MKQKIFTLLLAIIASVGITFAKTYSGTCGENLTWTLTTEDGVITISGEGKMTNYKGSDMPWYAYLTAITSVTIGNNVTTIGRFAFSDCSCLTSVTIPNSVTSIGWRAFNDCISLTSIDIPSGVTSIETYTFYNCRKLTSVTIPNSVTSIKYNAFTNCSSLTSVTIPNSVTDIEGEAFDHCSGLTSVTISNGVTSIGNKAFASCSSLTSVIIPNSVTGIETEAFYNCEKLTSVTIGNNVKVIGSSAFVRCSSLTSVIFGNSVTSIGEYAFNDCSSLSSIICKAVTPPTVKSYVFQYVDKSIPLYVPAESVEDYKIYTGWKDFTNIKPIEGTDQEMFTITFANYDGTILQSTDVKAGTMPVYSYLTPTRPADAQYTYTFAGWTPEIVAVTGDATYTAVFEETLNTYTITWQDESGNVIRINEVGYGLTPEFTGPTPTKAATNEYTYEFAGWLPKIKSVTKDICYTTFFERNKIEPTVYTVNINGENCSLNINNQYPEGTVITIETVADECFEFQQWSDGNKDNPRTVTVTKDMNLTAEFNKLRYTISGEVESSKGGKVQIIKK